MEASIVGVINGVTSSLDYSSSHFGPGMRVNKEFLFGQLVVSFLLMCLNKYLMRLCDRLTHDFVKMLPKKEAAEA